MSSCVTCICSRVASKYFICYCSLQPLERVCVDSGRSEGASFFLAIRELQPQLPWSFEEGCLAGFTPVVVRRSPLDERRLPLCRLFSARKARPEMLHHCQNPHPLIGGTRPDHVDSDLVETATATDVVEHAALTIWRFSADRLQSASALFDDDAWLAYSHQKYRSVEWFAPDRSGGGCDRRNSLNEAIRKTNSAPGMALCRQPSERAGSGENRHHGASGDPDERARQRNGLSSRSSDEATE